MYRKILTLCLLCCLPAHADLPLTVEDILTAKGQWRVNLGLDYANAETSGIDAAAPLQVQVGPSQFVSVPTAVGQSRQFTDVLIGSAGLHYGLTGKLELYGRSSALYESRRSQGLQGGESSSSERWNDIWLGANYELNAEGKRPALYGVAELALAERSTDGQQSYGRSMLLGFTSYKTNDPLVLTLTGAWRYNLPRDAGAQRLQPGAYLLLQPSVGFAANSDVTLTAGLSWRNQQPDRIDGQSVGLRSTSTAVTGSLAYAWSNELTLTLNSKHQASGPGGAEIGLHLYYKFGKTPDLPRLPVEATPQ